MAYFLTFRFSRLGSGSFPVCRRFAKCGWTQVVMAEKVGINRSFLADVERGKRNISILNLDLIARGLRVSLAQLPTKL